MWNLYQNIEGLYFLKTPRLEQIELNIIMEMDKDNEFYYIRVNL